MQGELLISFQLATSLVPLHVSPFCHAHACCSILTAYRLLGSGLGAGGWWAAWGRCQVLPDCGTWSTAQVVQEEQLPVWEVRERELGWPCPG